MIIVSGLDQGQGGVGLSFRDSNTLYGGSGYRISFDAQGAWTFGYGTGGTDHPLMGGTCPYFITGFNQPNFITVKVQGSQIEATVNNHDLFTTTDTTLKMGMVGMEMGTGNNGEATVVFNDAKVWQLN